jgi:hypothetical protein
MAVISCRNETCMKKISTYLCVAILSGSATTCRVDAQGLSEGDFVQAGAAGLGAGLAASGRHGQVATRSYEAMLQARQAALLQTKTIEHYMSLGADYQTKRQLANAEAAYKYNPWSSMSHKATLLPLPGTNILAGTPSPGCSS